MPKPHQVPPNPDELEISIFGPGKGECVLLHIGDNEWCVIDSCIARGRTGPLALEYLSQFPNAVENVRLVLATHWHDDHINGLATILRAAHSAEFCCSVALKQDEFLTLVESSAQALTGKSGVEEFSRVLEELKARGPIPPTFAVENRRLKHFPGQGRSFPFSLTALSPSDLSIKLALQEIAGLMPKAGGAQLRIPNRSPNHASVVLWVEAAGIRVLLGADLEQTGNAGEGWTAVVNCHQDTVPARFFKVPHHGSKGADHQDVWDKMLEPNPVAVITPFNAGNVRLPKESDLERLATRTDQLYCTNRGAGKSPARDRGIEREMRLQVPDRRVIEGQPGHVRIRFSTTDTASGPDVELFNGAYQFT